jgi:hypothetical protein
LRLSHGAHTAHISFWYDNGRIEIGRVHMEVGPSFPKPCIPVMPADGLKPTTTTTAPPASDAL